MYEKAGADVIFIESPQTEEELKIVANSFDKPAMANMIEGGKTPLLTAAELNEMGFKLVAFAVSCLLAATKAIQRAMKVLKEQGTTRAMVAEMMHFEDFKLSGSTSF
jgi:methylisocitrate lyase